MVYLRSKHKIYQAQGSKSLPNQIIYYTHPKMVRKGPSTWYWIKQMLRHEEAHHEALEMMEKYAEDEMKKKFQAPSKDKPQTSNDKSEPINIICVDGGGAKGMLKTF